MEFIKCVKGNFILTRNYRDAFNLEKFSEKYLEEYFDKYLYIVGDISSGILRLKGFDDNPKSQNYCGNIDNYLDTSCAFGCPFFVLKRVKSEEDFQKYEKNHHERDEESKYKINPIEKENFDKESLILETSKKSKPNITIDADRINTLPIGSLPADLVEKDGNSDYNKSVNTKPVEEATQTYVSSSPDFDPSKKQNGGFKRYNNKNKNKNNNNKKK